MQTSTPRWRQQRFNTWQPQQQPDGSWVVVMERMLKEPVTFVDHYDEAVRYKMDEDEALNRARALNAERYVQHEPDPLEQDPGIALPSGGYYKFLDPHSSTFTIEDIAHTLSNLPRFAGATKHPFSVAMHSVNVSRLVPPELALEGLLHDGGEGLGFGDMMSPLKRLCPEYCRLLDNADEEIARRERLNWPHHPAVKLADMRALKAETDHLIPQAYAYERAMWPDWSGFEVPPEKLKLLILREMPATEAKARFMSRYRELTSGRA